MEKDTNNLNENGNLQNNLTDSEKVDFDAMFDAEDIETWGYDIDGDKIAANEMHAGVK